jgi:hypothetical protein
MSATPVKYRALPGRAKKLFGFFEYTRYRLWLSDDHLLNVQMKVYSESCRRYFLRDIQAITITRTQSGRTLNIVLGILAAVFLLLGLILNIGSTEPVSFLWTGPLVAIFLISLAINTAFGPTCKTRLYTAVQAEDLVSLSRLRTARKVAAMLKPYIEAAQGRLTPEALETASAEPVTVTPAASAGSAAPLPFARPAAAEPEVRHERGNYHAAFFAMNLLFALSSLIDIFWQHRIKNTIDTIMILPFVALAIVALLKQRRSDLPSGIKVMPWISLAIVMAGFLFISFYTPIYAVTHPDILRSGFAQTPLEGPAFLVFLSLETVAYLSIGLIGALRLNKFQTAPDSALSASAPGGGTGAGNA